MLVGGLWHGAGWTFVLWGGLHGSLLIINHFWRKIRVNHEFLNRSFGVGGYLIAWALTFFSVINSWVLFRSSGFESAKNVFKCMYTKCERSELGFENILQKINYMIVQQMNPKFVILLILLILAGTLLLPNTYSLFLKKEKKNIPALQIDFTFSMTNRWAWIIAILFILSILHLNHVTPFLYFQF